MTPTIVIRPEMGAYDPMLNAYSEFVVEASPSSTFSSRRVVWPTHASGDPSKPDVVILRMTPGQVYRSINRVVVASQGSCDFFVKQQDVRSSRSHEQLKNALLSDFIAEWLDEELQDTTSFRRGVVRTAVAVASLVLTILLAIPALFWRFPRAVWKTSFHQLCCEAVRLRNAVATPLGFGYRRAPQRWFAITL